MASAANPSLNRINNVQALRGLAALLVVLGHAEYSLPGLLPFGTFGVDIFFVISGFIMAMIVARNPEKFFLRRLIRIVPLYWTATFGVFALAAWKPEWMMHTRANLGELVLSLLFVPFFKNGATDHVNPVLFVGWTLNYEMFFYVVLAGCLLVSRKRATVLASGVIFLLMLGCAMFGHYVHQSAATLLYGDTIILEFLLGMAAWSIVAGTPQPLAVKLRGVAAGAAALALLVMIGIQATTWFPGWPLPRLVTSGVPSFFLVAGAALLSRTGWDTRSRAAVLLGDASYVIYILHTYVLDGFNRLLAPLYPALAIDRLAGCLLSVSLVVGLSVVLYLTAEKPAVDWLSGKLGTRRIRQRETQDPAESMA